MARARRIKFWMVALVAAVFALVSCSCASTPLRGIVMEQVPLSAIEKECAALLGIDGFIAEGIVTGCDIEVRQGDHIVDHMIRGNPYLIEPEPEPEPEAKLNPHEHQDDEDQPCERHREGDEEFPSQPGDFAI